MKGTAAPKLIATLLQGDPRTDQSHQISGLFDPIEFLIADHHVNMVQQESTSGPTNFIPAAELRGDAGDGLEQRDGPRSGSRSEAQQGMQDATAQIDE